jgi:hypothetical protein
MDILQAIICIVGASIGLGLLFIILDTVSQTYKLRDDETEEPYE